MKRKVSLLLAALMIVSMTATLASCGGNQAETTTEGGTTTSAASSTTSSAKSPNPTVPSNPTTPESTNGPLYTGDLPLVEADNEYAYKVFNCPYSSTGAGGTYDAEQDELLQYMSQYAWATDDLTIPDAAMEDIKSWTDKVTGPFGDCNVSAYGYSNADIGWTDQNHGLMVYTTFTIDNLEEFKATYEDLYMVFWYDNTPSVYINGTLVFHMDTECTGNPGDWVDTFTDVIPDDDEDERFTEASRDMLSLLVEGENNVVIILKDAWGGRECCFELGATPDAVFH